MTLRPLRHGAALLALVVTAAVLVGVPVRHPLVASEVSLDQGNAYSYPLPRLSWPLEAAADDSETRGTFRPRLLEDGQPLGPPRMKHNRIRLIGKGRYSLWRGRLYFSTTDNSDPRTNGRRYVVVRQALLPPEALLGALLLMAVVFADAAARGLRSGRLGRRDVLAPAGLWLGALFLLGVTTRTRGAALWLSIGLAFVALAWACATTRHTFGKAARRLSRGYRRTQRITLAVGSLCLALVVVETRLAVWETRVPEAAAAGEATPPQVKAKAKTPPRETTELEQALLSREIQVPEEILRLHSWRSALVTLPPELGREPMTVDGAAKAYRWHGALHVKDENGMRRATPFPAKKDGVLRIMVVGDSLTYGAGVPEERTYARQLESHLRADYDVEILNLGVEGYQSEDVLAVVERYLPRLEADLVVYGVCLNDFLPAGVGQYQNNYAYQVPLPEDVKRFLTSRSRLARWVEDGYDQLLLGLGLRLDFYGDILTGFESYQARFARDVAGLNDLVKAAGLPPTLALTLDQFPMVGSQGHQISQAAERHLKSAGMDVIEMDTYYRDFDGERLKVSRWEGHPNEVAHAIWAAILDRHIRTLPLLRSHRLPRPGVAPE